MTTSPPPRMQRASGESRVAFDLRDGADAPGRPLSTRSLPGFVPRTRAGRTAAGGACDHLGRGHRRRFAQNGGRDRAGGASRGDHPGGGKDLPRREGQRPLHHRRRRCGSPRAPILDWLPQETIVFEGARLKRRTVAEVVEPGGSLLACEMVVLGRAALGRAFHLRPAARCLVGAPSTGRLVWTDTLRRGRDADRCAASARPMRSPR